jgi:hypothetical protein
LYADRNPAIDKRVLTTLRELAGIVQRPQGRQAIAEVASFVWRSSAKDVADERHRSELLRLREDVHRLCIHSYRAMPPPAHRTQRTRAAPRDR